MGSNANLKCASHRESVPNSNVDTREQVQRPNQRFNFERIDIRPAAQQPEEEKKAVQPQQPRRASNNVAVSQMQARVQVLREPANVNAA